MASHTSTFSNWIKAARAKGVSLDLVVNREEDYARMAACGLPTFDYRVFSGDDKEGIKKFYDMYKIIIAILYPKSAKDGQPWKFCRNYEELREFLEINEPLSRFRITLGENKEPQRGGTIISYDSHVFCELGEGNQANLAHDINNEIWRAESRFGMPFHYSANCTDDIKGDIWHALSEVKCGKGFLEGYFEFFVCGKMIHFIDYKTDSRFFKPK